MRVYYAHPMTTYGSEQEQADLELIRVVFGPDAEIINPNHPDHQAGCKILGMTYFTEIVKLCDAVVGRSFEDGEWGSGVYAELAAAGAARKLVYEIDDEYNVLNEIDYKSIRPLSIQETKFRTKAWKEKNL